MRQVSPLNRRRWRNFKANRRGLISLWLFGVLFFVTLFAEFLANDKPLLVLITCAWRQQTAPGANEPALVLTNGPWR